MIKVKTLLSSHADNITINTYNFEDNKIVSLGASIGIDIEPDGTQRLFNRGGYIGYCGFGGSDVWIVPVPRKIKNDKQIPN